MSEDSTMTLTPFSYYDLIETFPKPGCAVCALLLRDVERHLDSILYEYVLDPGTQQSFRASRGLCNTHGWALLRPGAELGIATLYERILSDLIDDLRTITPPENGRGLAQRLLRQDSAGTLDAAAPCPVCVFQQEREDAILKTLGDYLNDEPLRDAWRASDGLCLTHMQRALKQMRDPQKTAVLIEIQTAIWQGLHSELLEFMRKSDFSNVDEIMGPEGTSWLRTLARISSEKGVFGRQRRD